MSKKCLYCGKELDDSCVVDFCNRCGVGVFGERMFNTIINNMEDARDRGDLCHSSSEEPQKSGENFTNAPADYPVSNINKTQEDF